MTCPILLEISCILVRRASPKWPQVARTWPIFYISSQGLWQSRSMGPALESVVNLLSHCAFQVAFEKLKTIAWTSHVWLSVKSFPAIVKSLTQRSQGIRRLCRWISRGQGAPWRCPGRWWPRPRRAAWAPSAAPWRRPGAAVRRLRRSPCWMMLDDV